MGATVWKLVFVFRGVVWIITNVHRSMRPESEPASPDAPLRDEIRAGRLICAN